jgi:glycosyltransferase involved in cell wall biosynthesis
MKIGIDCRLWGETGVGRYIRNLVLNLQEIDTYNNYVLFALKKDSEKIKFEIRNSKFEIHIADIKWHTVDEQFEFPKVLNKENLDLVHFPYFSVPIFYCRPFIITIHDLIVNYFSTGKASTLPGPIYKLKLLAYKFILQRAAKNAIKIIAVSNATKNEVTKTLKVKKEKIVVTHEGADDKIRNSNIDIQNNAKNTKYKIPNTKYFLYVGNAYPHKNLDRLLEAFKLLVSDTSLIMVGREDPFYRKLKEKVKRMDLSNKVIFLQNISDEELSNLYKNAIALIMPSLMEGFGLPVLEAMANSCLVLASDIPALQEICADAAIYFDPRNIADITGKMRESLLNLNSSKKEKGLERAKLFSWQKMAKETLEIYESCFGL